MCNCSSSKVHVINDGDGFVNLHLHTNYSLLDGLSHVEDVVKKVASLKQKAVAITEHGNTFSAVKAHKLAEKENVKHIYGMEAYITEDRFVKDKTKRYYHITLLAENEQGRINLNKLASLGFLEGFYYKPRIDFEILKKYKDGIIILSGCMGSIIQQTLAGGKIGDGEIVISEENYNKAKSIAREFRDIYGKNFYMEVQAHRDSRQQLLNRKVIDIAKELNIAFVATTDSHMVEEIDHELHSIFIQIGTNREAGEVYEDTFIMSAKEVYDRLDSLTVEEREKAILESVLISDRCNVKLPLSAPIIPHNEIPSEFEDEVKYLKHLINKGWLSRGINKKSSEDKLIYKNRLNYEFNAISKMGFEGYFLFVNSYANSVRRRGIARGSGGGSLVAYLLRITNIDPIPFNLYFERFIDVSALDDLESGKITKKELKLPDFDLDFSPSERDLVEQQIIKTFTQEKYASIGQFGYIWDKSAIKDVGKVLNIPYDERNKITQQLGDLPITLARETGQLKGWFDKYPKLFEYAEKLAGTPKSFGVHPCAKVAFNREIQWHTPVAQNGDVIVLQCDMHDAEDLGATKTDILGLRSLDIIYDTIELAGIEDEFINPDTLDYKDENVLDLFRKGNTVSIFQFESGGMRDTLRKMIPDGIEDLGVANALFRPSSIKFIDHYADRKSGKEPIEYLHPDLEEILGETYGIWVFQEQMISLAKLSGMKSPDTIRKAIGKKNLALMEKSKDELFDGLRNRGWNEEQLDVLWKDMIDYSSYSFNKSHSSAYAIIAFQMAKLKAYHPLEYMTSVLNNKMSKREEMSIYIDECKKMGIKILPPDINKSDAKFKIEGKAIRFGLLGIKTIGEPTIEMLNKVQSTLLMLTDGHQDEFVSFEDFYNTAKAFIFESQTTDENGEIIFTESMIAKDSVINLIKSGAFGMNRNELLLEYAEFLYEPLKYKERKTIPSKSDFIKNKIEISDEDYKDKPTRHKIFIEFKYREYINKNAIRRQRHIDEFKEKYIGNEKFYDFDTMSNYISLSPFDNYISRMKDLYDYNDGETKVLIMGTILEKTVKKSGKGGQYAKLSIVSPFGVYHGKAYSHVYAEYKDIIEKNETVVILAKRAKDEFIISKMVTFKDWKNNIKRKKEARMRHEERINRNK